MKRTPAAMLFASVTVLMVVGFGRVLSQVSEAKCKGCENLPSEWSWDANEDGQDDFVFEYTCISFGGGPSRCWVRIRPLPYAAVVTDSGYGDETHPLRAGELIDGALRWNERWPARLASVKCVVALPFYESYWNGPWIEGKEAILGMRLAVPMGGWQFGWAKISCSACTGEVTVKEKWLSQVRDQGVWAGKRVELEPN